MKRLEACGRNREHVALLRFVAPDFERGQRRIGARHTPQVDPAAAARLSPNDRQRLIRALEVVTGTGKSLLAWQEEGRSRAVLAEAEVADEERGSVFARAEFVQKTADDLALPDSLPPGVSL